MLSIDHVNVVVASDETRYRDSSVTIEGTSSSGTNASNHGRNQATSAIEYSSMAAYYDAVVGSVITNALTSSLSSRYCTWLRGLSIAVTMSSSSNADPKQRTKLTLTPLTLSLSLSCVLSLASSPCLFRLRRDVIIMRINYSGGKRVWLRVPISRQFAKSSPTENLSENLNETHLFGLFIRWR